MSLTCSHISVRQDQLAADMYSFFSKEGDYAHYFVTVSAARSEMFEHEFMWECLQLQDYRGTDLAGQIIYFLLLLFLFNLIFPILFLQLLEAQADYHRKSLTVLESVLPAIQAQQGKICLQHIQHNSFLQSQASHVTLFISFWATS